MGSTADRLNGYYNFSPEVIGRVDEVAEIQRGFDNYRDYFDHLKLPEPRMFKGQAIIDIRPPKSTDYDETQARACHFPMGNSLDPNMQFQVATLYAADPTTRLVAIGNPSGIGYPGGTLSPGARRSVMRGDLRPTIEPLLDYLNQEGVTSTQQVGYSYGAEKAAVASTFSEKYDQTVRDSVMIEPPAVKERKLRELALQFMASDAHLDEYVEASDEPAFIDARKNSISALNYTLGIFKLSNLAIARALTKPYFETRVADALSNQAELKAHIIWGSESELAIDGLVATAVQQLRREFTADRVKSIRLVDQKHALANDIHLQTALVLQSVGLAA